MHAYMHVDKYCVCMYVCLPLTYHLYRGLVFTDVRIESHTI